MRRKKSAAILLGIMLVIACFNSHGQQFYSVGVKDGLSDSYVTSVGKDHLGFMWFATRNGLNRYDGYNFSVYSLTDFGLNYNGFSYVAEDAGNNLWIKSSTGRLYVYDRVNDRISSGWQDILTKYGIDAGNVSDLFVDKSGKLWIMTDGCLQSYDYSSGNITSYQVQGRCRSLVSGNNHTYASFADGSIRQILPELKCILEDEEGLDGLSVDSMDRVWISGRELKCYNPHEESWMTFPDIQTYGNGISGVVDDGKGSLWIAINGTGLLKSNYDLSQTVLYCNEYRNGFSLPSNHINSLYLDDESLLWLGLGKKGAAFYSPDEIRIERTETGVSEEVGTIVEDRKGNVWVGFDGKGLVRLSGGKDAVSTTPMFPNYKIIGSFVDEDNTLYLSTYGNGIICMKDGRARKLESNDPDFDDKVARSNGIVKDNNGNIWICTFNNGVICLLKDGSTRSFDLSNSALASNFMVSMSFSKEENAVFVCTRESAAEISADKFEMTKSWTINQGSSLWCDSRGILWIGTTDGLFYINRKAGGNMHAITTSEGLSSPYVCGICSDQNDNLWVTTTNGVTNIYVFQTPNSDILEIKCQPFYDKNGLGSGNFTHNAITLTGDGRILMGYDGDVITAYPQRYAPSQPSGKMVISSISINGEKLSGQDYSNGGNIRTKFYDNIDIKVSSLDYRHIASTIYEYRTDSNSNWTTMESNSLPLRLIPSGQHSIWFRVSDNYGVSSDSIRLSLNVAPPFYRTKAAILVYIIILAGMILLLSLLLLHRSREKLAREKFEMDEEKLQFFTNVSHDLRTPLTMIITPLSRLIHEHKGSDIEEDLNLMDRSAQTLMDAINQILEFRKLDKSKISFHPSYGDFSRFVSEVTYAFTTVFSDDSVNISTDITSEQIMMDFDKEKMQRILHNLLSNAYKYNNPDGDINVSLVRKGDWVELKVSDSGIGISDESKPHIFERYFQDASKGAMSGNGIGLHIVQEYTRLHGGEITVADNKPRGTVFTITLPVRDTMRSDIPDMDINDPAEFSDRPKILIAEDNEHFRAFLGRCLSEKYDVVPTRDGKEAMESLAKYSFDLVISDVMMPVMNGIELCKEIKNNILYSHIPVILLTAAQDKKTMLKGLQEGADEYISKPFDYQVLDLKVQTLLKRTKENHDKWESLTADTSDTTMSRLDRELIEKMTEAIEKNLSNSDYSVEDLSSDMCISRSGLYKKLMFITGKSPIEFIRLLRLRKGREMLDQGETSISQIAWKIGFSPKLFSKYFKDEFGIVPSEYIHQINLRKAQNEKRN